MQISETRLSSSCLAGAGWPAMSARKSPISAKIKLRISGEVGVDGIGSARPLKLVGEFPQLLLTLVDRLDEQPAPPACVAPLRDSACALASEPSGWKDR